MRLNLHIPVLIVLLLLAATLQENVGVSAWLPVKLPLLQVVSLYVTMTRPVQCAVVVAVLAGGVADALSGLPMLCTASWLLTQVAFVYMLKIARACATVWRGALYGGLFFLGELFWTMLCVQGFQQPMSWGEMPMYLLAVWVTGCVSGAMVFVIGGKIDAWAWLPSMEEEDVLGR